MDAIHHKRARQHETIVTEVPSALKQLARMIVRGFYTMEDSLIIDMLVRNPCMREDDIGELLLFEKKQLRARLTLLRCDKFLQSRLKMETGPDGKAQKVNYYFINYKVFVNVVKYKLDLMRKRLETEERDATNRASFKCTFCYKTFTDLEADQLFDFTTQQFTCTFCSNIVEEDGSAMPKMDSRLMLAKFNDQIQPLFDLLRSVEGVTLSPELLEPEPVDIDIIRGRLDKSRNVPPRKPDAFSRQWTGEATRKTGLHVEETRVNINIGDKEVNQEVKKARERPVWMTQSTVLTPDSTDAILAEAAKAAIIADEHKEPFNNIGPTIMNSLATNSTNRKKDMEDIMAILLANEKNLERKDKSQDDTSSDSDTDFETVQPKKLAQPPQKIIENDDVIVTDAPEIIVNGCRQAIDTLSAETMENMTPQEQEMFINVYQAHFGYLFD